MRFARADVRTIAASLRARGHSLDYLRQLRFADETALPQSFYKTDGGDSCKPLGRMVVRGCESIRANDPRQAIERLWLASLPAVGAECCCVWTGRVIGCGIGPVKHRAPPSRRTGALNGLNNSLIEVR